MNIFSGQITNIESNGHLSLVDVNVQNVHFTSVVIETPDTSSFLKVGHEIKVMFKETEVSLSKERNRKISLQNKLVCEVLKVNQGAILATVTMKHPIGELESVVTARAIRQLNLSEGDEVLAMIKTNEIMLSAG